MSRIAIVGAMISGLVLSGCAAQDDAWNLIVAEDYQAAQALYQSRLAVDPNDPYVNLNLGATYEELGNMDMAAKHYQVAIENGKDAKIEEVAQDGSVVKRVTTVSTVAQENLATIGS